jgi:hypothetical protein
MEANWAGTGGTGSKNNSLRCCGLSRLNQTNKVAHVPEALLKATSHSGRHTDGVVNPGKIIPRRVEGNHMDVVVDPLGMGRSKAGKPLHMLAHCPVSYHRHDNLSRRIQAFPMACNYQLKYFWLAGRKQSLF